VTEEDIQKVLDLRPQLPNPFRLGIFFKDSSGYSGPYSHSLDASHWQPSDKQKILQIGESLKSSGVVSDTTFISGETSRGQDLKSVRLAGARHGVDAVLVVSGVADVDRYNNSLGPTYALIITPFFVPGTVVDALFISHAGLWDVRNEFLYASAEADGFARQTRSAFLIREDEAVSVARDRSITELATAIEKHVQNLRD